MLENRQGKYMSQSVTEPDLAAGKKDPPIIPDVALGQ